MAVELSGDIHELTLTFPKAELFVLTSQIKRAADSISLNIAEGSTSQSDPEFSRFLGYASRSGLEVVTCLYLAKRRNLIDEVTFQKFYKDCNLLITKIQALRKTLKKK